MRRRDFIMLLGVMAAWPLAARSQQALPVVGFLNGASPQGYAPYLTGFLQGLREAGYREGENVAIEYRWAEGDYGRLPELAADLVRRQVALIVANTPAVPAAKAATTTIPIVFLSGADPIKAGLVTSLSRPGGNVTGVTFIAGELLAKQLGLLHELKPSLTSVALLANPKHPNAQGYVSDAQAAAGALDQQTHVLNASGPTEINVAFATLPQLEAGALIVLPDAFFIDHRDQIVALAARYNIPAVYPFPSYTTAGGLMSYGTSVTDLFRQAGVYAGKILKGAKPAELPVLQPTKFEFVINLSAAKALGITFPPSLFARADAVIE